MKFIISVLVCWSAASADIRQPGRQSFAYNNNIIHHNPNYPDQTGQSSVQVNFNPNELQQVPPPYNIYQPQYQQQVQTFNPNNPQSQLFNVGYSVKFTNNQLKLPHVNPQQQQHPKIPEGDIITGTRKGNEQVQRPEEFVSSLENKKHKISGLKPKPSTIVQNYPNPKVVLNQANLSPTTQQYLKYLEHTKQPQDTQELQQRYSWRNLSPGVEIIRSTEVPAKYSQEFDHAKALGRSQEFDYTNAVENQDLAQFYKQAQENLPPITRELPQASQHQQIQAQSPQMQVLPEEVDTSLLREPVPIQVDTRLLEEAMKYYKQPRVQSQYRTIPPTVEYQRNPNQFYKPQPLTSIHPEQAPRQARFIPDLQTNLRPPPYNPNPHQRFQRRIYLG